MPTQNAPGPEPSAALPAPALDLPGAAHPALAQLRRAIDAVDLRLLDLLAVRAHLALEVGAYKQQRGLPVHDRERERTLLEGRAALGALPLDPAAVRQIFEAIVTASRTLQERRAADPHRAAE